MKNKDSKEMADLFDKDLRKIKRAKYDDMDDTFIYKEKVPYLFLFFHGIVK